MLDEEGTHVVHVRHLQAGSTEEALEGQLHALLRSPHGEMPDAIALVALRLGEDETRLPEVAAGDLAACHSSMFSPGWKSRFKIQYRTRPRRRRSAPTAVRRARNRASTSAKNPPRSTSKQASSTMSR